MQVKAPQDSMPDGRNHPLYPLMLIAAISVIVLSLVGIASMTGLIPRSGTERPSTETRRDKQRGAPDKQQQNIEAPAGKPSGPATRPEAGKPRRIVGCEDCAEIKPVRSVGTRNRAAGTGALLV